MALRLTGKTLQSPTPAAAPAVTSESLAFQARTALGRGDVSAFSALFIAANELTDPQRRFHGKLTLIDAGMSATAQASEGLATRVYLAIATAALDMLEDSPSEPTILNLAGVALYELWSLDAAQALFRAARRLDASLPNVEANLDEVARRKRAGRRTRPLHAALPALARRATSVANRAKPTSGLTLSLCMIVRDEEQMLPRCLAAVASAVDEIVIVDTGSTDATVEIARSFGAKVIEFPWTGSFSEARNVSFEAATGDWVMYLDADEVLVAEDIEQLRALTGRTWREAFYLVETSYTGELGDGGAMVNNALRVFRNRPEYRFRDRLHEQIAHTLPTYIPGRVEQTPVRVTHYGYLGSVRDAKEKSQRNIELLRKQSAESPKTPFLHFNLGSEYIVAGDFNAAIDELKTARALVAAEGNLTRAEYVPSLFTRLVTVLRMAGSLLEADTTAAEGLELFPRFTDLVLAQARIAQTRGDTDEALALFDRAIEMGEAPARYSPMVGSGTFLARLALAELHLELGEPALARTALQWCVEHHPDYAAVAGPYASALLRDGVAPGDVVAELDKLDVLPAAIRRTVAAILQQAGAADEAAAQYQLALEAAPTDARARTSLAELRLGRGAWDEAAELAAAVPTDDPYAALAVRIELCSLIGRADAGTVHPVLRRATSAGLSATEVAVFETWSAVAQGATETAPVPVAGAPLLAVILETLLHGADGERFVALLPVLEHSQLPRREQRELLAQMYLKAGLVDRAAQEWLAAASETPDVRSMVGLAQVALAQGMAQDAANFVTAALELDPASAQAKALLSALPAPVAA
ncbi:MAG TPA: glycosyltransferase family 2 protein [Solirubrobacteraceae bacterium]|nr:glycosyltransferase family 2 protein [Solirubrobacteraceae bacterium]